MANETYDPKKPAGAAATPQKRPNTIDLTATEIKPEPSAKPESAAKPRKRKPRLVPNRARRRQPNRPSSQDRQAAGEPMAAEPAAPQNASRAADSRPAARRSTRGGGPAAKGLPWPVIGIALAAAVIFFAVGLGAGQWLSSRAPQPVALAPQPVAAALSPELQARIDKLETQLGAPPKEDPQLQARLAKLEAQLNAPRAAISNWSRASLPPKPRSRRWPT